jgi:hypothetical protein
MRCAPLFLLLIHAARVVGELPEAFKEVHKDMTK